MNDIANPLTSELYDSTVIYGSYRKLANFGDAMLILIIEQDMLKKPQKMPDSIEQVAGEDGLWRINDMGGTFFCTREVLDKYLDYLKIPTNRPTAYTGG